MLNLFLVSFCCIGLEYDICIWSPQLSWGVLFFQTAIKEGMIYVGFLYHHLNMAHHLSTPQNLPIKTIFAQVHHLTITTNPVLSRTPMQVLLLIIRYFISMLSLTTLGFFLLYCTVNAVAFLLVYFHSQSSCRRLFMYQSGNDKFT